MEQQVTIHNTGITVDSTVMQKIIRKLQMTIVNFAGRSTKENDHLDHVDVTLLIHQCINHWLTFNAGQPIYSDVDFSHYFSDTFKTAAKQYNVDDPNDTITMQTMSSWFTTCLRYYSVVINPAVQLYTGQGRMITNVVSHDIESERTQFFIVSSDAIIPVTPDADEDLVVDDDGNESVYVPPVKEPSYL